MTSSPTISYIVACFNYGRYLPQAIESVHTQTLRVPIEIVVIDDGSTDETEAVVRALDDPHIRFVRHPENQGPGLTFQEGVHLTLGKYVVQLDADDLLLPHFVEATLPILERGPELAMVYGDVSAIDGNGRMLAEIYGSPSPHAIHAGRDFQGNELVLFLFENVAWAHSRLMRGAPLRALVPFPPTYHPRFGMNDWYCNLQLAAHHDVYYIARTLAQYRMHERNQHRRGLRQKEVYEDTIMAILDQLYAAPPPALLAGTPRGERLRKEVYAHAYKTLADRYFGNQEYTEARRCYLRALSYAPLRVLKRGGLHRLAGTWLGSDQYVRIKELRRALGGAAR